ncbi:MAG: hypothetical protein K1X57_03010 [Gemmataceae bacterium]|nr:hypothetical protein [Gemmataceae bacterium]
MKSPDSHVLDRLLRESYANSELHPILKRMVLRSTVAALRHVTPENYAEKCHGAALAIFMVLRSLRIRSTIVGGTVSWLFGGVDTAGLAWQTRSGFWSHNPALPTPHAWLVTEFGGLVDLTCSFFHMTWGRDQPGQLALDQIPIIWLKTEHLAKLPNLQYTPTARFRAVDLHNCDEMARQSVGRALMTFWGDPAMNALMEPSVEPETVLASLESREQLDMTILDSPQALERLGSHNTWVARNSVASNDHGLAAPPIN